MKNSYREYYTIEHRNDQRVVILNDNARPTRMILENKKPRKEAPRAFERGDGYTWVSLEKRYNGEKWI